MMYDASTLIEDELEEIGRDMVQFIPAILPMLGTTSTTVGLPSCLPSQWTSAELEDHDESLESACSSFSLASCA